MFRNRRELRRWAARALLLWTRVANACWTESLVQPGGHHPNAAAAHETVLSGMAQPECELHGGLHHAAPDEAAPGCGEPHANSVCQPYCDGFGASITALKAPIDETAAPAIAVATFAFAAPVAGTSRGVDRLRHALIVDGARRIPDEPRLAPPAVQGNRDGQVLLPSPCAPFTTCVTGFFGSFRCRISSFPVSG